MDKNSNTAGKEAENKFQDFKEKLSELKQGQKEPGKEETDTKPKEKKESRKEKKSDKETIEELTDSLQRLQAEFDNYRKRLEKEKQEFVKYSKAEIIENILPILDSFELALRNSKDPEKFRKGVEMIYAQLVSALEREGLRPINAAGKKFDPYYHEVLLKEKFDKDEDIVLEELQKGYMLNDRVLRYSKVKVSQK
ncbi:nucleotide exchange factor GrpE [Candidatus Woesearchaeota archaeon]|nr:nucleotide exchange factor GrpE [Candidatus Woesearchaeota archaeon]